MPSPSIVYTPPSSNPSSVCKSSKYSENPQMNSNGELRIVEASTPTADGSRRKIVPGGTPDESDNGNSGTQGIGAGPGSGAGSQDNFSGASRRGGDRKNSNNSGNPLVTFGEDRMKREEERIRTFENWPLDFLTPQVLAAAGFYHIRDDLVRCAFCKIEIVKWEIGDIPMKEHKRWSASCPFVRGVPCGNVPIGESSSSHGSQNGGFSEDSFLAYDTCGIHEEMRPFSFCDDEHPSTSTHRHLLPIMKAKRDGDEEKFSLEPPLEKLSVRDFRAAVHPEFCSEASRLSTYSSWPVSMKQRPNVLADAGFYYTGNGDQTICFHCGGGLRDWEEGDDPWVEHAKWFSRCHFVNLVKGTEFVSQVAETRPAVLNAEEARGLTQTSLPPIKAETVSVVASNPVPMESESNACNVASTSQSTAAVSEQVTAKGGNKEAKDEVRLCKICYAAELGVVFLPCGHMVACVKCAPSLPVCPVCRQKFTHTVRAYIP